MKKLLITIATPEIRTVAEPFLINQAAYAARNNYEYRVEEKRFFKNLHPSFSKTGYCQKALREGYDLILFADLDVVFLDQGVDLANLLTGDYWFAAYWQKNWNKFKYLCAGLFVLKNTPKAVEFVDEWVERCELGCPDWVPGIRTPVVDHPWENWHASALFQKYKYEGIRCCSADEIGSFCPEIWMDGIQYKRGMPTMHFAGQMASWPRRVQIFQEKYASLVC